MKRSTILALMEGHKQRLNESLIFWKATNDIKRAGPEFVATDYTTKRHEFYDGPLPFDIKSGSTIHKLTSYYKGNDVIIGIEVRTEVKSIIDRIGEYEIQQAVRKEIAKEVSKVAGYGIGQYSIDCKLTKLYLAEKLTWKEYCEAITGNC